MLSKNSSLGSRSKLAVKDFKCAWFDEKNYFEFLSFACFIDFIIIIPPTLPS